MLSEEDKKNISMVEFPRRFKKKKPKKEESEAFLAENKSMLLKAECLRLQPELEKEMEELLKDKYHSFMKEHFPNMYNLENYYTHLRMINIRRTEKKNELVAAIEDNYLMKKRRSF